MAPLTAGRLLTRAPTVTHSVTMSPTDGRAVPRIKRQNLLMSHPHATLIRGTALPSVVFIHFWYCCPLICFPTMVLADQQQVDG
jgi:hypothetical protein